MTVGPGSARLVPAMLAALMVLSAAPANALTPQIVQPEDGLGVAIKAMHQLATDNKGKKPRPLTTKPKPGLPIDLGKDGRLTMLLVGSDFRANAGGERTDVVMVATIDPKTGKAAVVSIPRDMSGIPLAGGSNSGGTRVNAIYYIRYRDPSLKHGQIDRNGFKRLSRDIGTFLGTEIDYWAMTRFDSFAGIVNTLGGLRLDVKEEVLDSSFHSGRTFGIWFPRADNVKLKGNPKCRPKPKKCRSALTYARSRHGTMGSQYNSDYRRAERQQDIVHAGVTQVLERAGSGIALLGMLLGVRQHVETDLPTTAEAAAQLFALLSKLNLPRANMKVLAPATWAYTDPDGTIKPNLSAIRRWVDKNFYDVRGRAGDGS